MTQYPTNKCTVVLLLGLRRENSQLLNCNNYINWHICLCLLISVYSEGVRAHHSHCTVSACFCNCELSLRIILRSHTQPKTTKKDIWCRISIKKEQDKWNKKRLAVGREGERSGAEWSGKIWLNICIDQRKKEKIRQTDRQTNIHTHTHPWTHMQAHKQSYIFHSTEIKEKKNKENMKRPLKLKARPKENMKPEAWTSILSLSRKKHWQTQNYMYIYVYLQYVQDQRPNLWTWGYHLALPVSRSKWRSKWWTITRENKNIYLINRLSPQGGTLEL